MSISVPFGFRVPRSTALFDLQAKAATAIHEVAQRSFVDTQARALVSIWDCVPHAPSTRDAIISVVGADEPRLQDRQDISGRILFMLVSRVLRLGESPNMMEPYLSLNLWSPGEDDEYLYGSFSNARRNVLDTDAMFQQLLSVGLIEEYAYWNGSDSQIADGELTEEQWEERGKAWRSVLYRRGPEFLDQVRLPVVGPDAFLVKAPAIEQAAQALSEKERKAALRELIVTSPMVQRIMERINPDLVVDTEAEKKLYAELSGVLRPFSMDAFFETTFTISQDAPAH